MVACIAFVDDEHTEPLAKAYATIPSLVEAME